AVCLGRFGYRYVLSGQVSCSEFFDQIRVQIRFWGAAQCGHVQAFQTQNQRGQQADSTGAHDRRFPWTPNFEPALDLVSLVDSFLYDGRRFQEHANMFEALRHLDDEFDIVHVIFRQIAVPQVDAPLVIGVVGGHIVRADQVIDARTRAAYRGHDVVARLQLRGIRTDSFHLAETLMADDQKIVSWGRCTVLGSVDFFVGSVNDYAQNFDQHTAAVWNLVQGRLG